MTPTRIAPRPDTGRPETATYSWIYVATVADGRCKIGITLDPERRRRQIEHASGMRFQIWTQRWVYAPGAAERFILDRWAGQRLHGEWLAPGAAEEIREYLLPRTKEGPVEQDVRAITSRSGGCSVSRDTEKPTLVKGRFTVNCEFGVAPPVDAAEHFSVGNVIQDNILGLEVEPPPLARLRRMFEARRLAA